MKITANLPKTSLNKNEKLIFTLNFELENNETEDILQEVSCFIAIVEFHPNIYVNTKYSTSKRINQKDNDIKFEINLSNLKNGLYCLYYIECKYDNDEAVYIENPDLVFEITDKEKRDFYSLIKERDIIIGKYNKMFNEGLGKRIEGKTTRYEAYIFCSDIYLGKLMKIGKCTITPYKGIDNRNIYDYINDYISSIDIIPLPKRNKDIEDYNPYNQPGSVIYFPVIHAPNPKIAGEIAHDNAKLVINSISLINNSYGTIIGDVLLDKSKNKKHYRCISYSYMGNLFVGFENPEKIFNIINEAQLNSVKKFYIELYLECCKERNVSYKYFKLWNLLETIAGNKNYIGKVKKDFNNNFCLNKRRNKILIQDNATDIVSELIREYYQMTKNENKKCSSNLNFSSIEDRISIWNQRRNCVAHRGSCIPDDLTICDNKSEKKKKCRKAYFEMKNKSKPQNFVDEYLFGLKYLVRDIVSIELNISK